MSFANTLIKASAGSGKTFQLSNRYLQLIFNGVSPETILATTFTRKAAGEILERILERLADAAFDDKKRRELSEYVLLKDRCGRHDGGDNHDNHDNRNNDESNVNGASNAETNGELSRQQVLAMLAQLMHNVHRLRISTLDSFFQQIAGNLSLELGMPPGWLILEEDDRSPLLLEGIRQMLEQIGKDKMVELMHLLFKGETRTRIVREINDIIRNLTEVYSESEPQAWQQLQRAKELSANEIKILVRDLAATEIAPTKKGTPNLNMLKARDKDLNMIREAIENGQPVDWELIGGSGICLKTLDKTYKYQRGDMPDSLCAAYEQIVTQVRATVINRLATQTEALGELLREITTIVDSLKTQRRLFDFSDVTYRLAKTTLDDKLHQITHRLDANTLHLLLDEFQDTSPNQWQVLRPFAERIVSQKEKNVESSVQKKNEHQARTESERQTATSFFCVGDIKQAIYGWRGGVAEIFDAIGNDLGKLNEEKLDKSYRSSQPVIDTVNIVFGAIASNAALINNSNQNDLGDNTSNPFANAAKSWEKRFKNHETDKKDFAGYCSLRTSLLPEETFDDQDNPIAPTAVDKERAHLRFVIDEIEELHKKSPTASIGVLTRTNDAIQKIIYGLRQRGIEASEEGGNTLDQSPAVELILSALSLSDYPGNRIARFHLANSPLAETLGVTLDLIDSEAEMQLASYRIRKCLIDEGYSAVLHDWVTQIAPACDERDLEKLIQLLGLASAYQRKAGVRTTPFINQVRTKRIDSPSSAMIRVMTAHRSKGLQFDIVVLPELDEKLSDVRTPKVISSREHPTGPISTVLAYPSKKIRNYLPDKYKSMIIQSETTRIEESLCVLYVGMTRAIHELMMIIMPKAESKKNKSKNDDSEDDGKQSSKFASTMAGVLHAALAPDMPLSEDTLLFPNSTLPDNNTLSSHRWRHNWVKHESKFDATQVTQPVVSPDSKDTAIHAEKHDEKRESHVSEIADSNIRDFDEIGHELEQAVSIELAPQRIDRTKNLIRTTPSGQEGIADTDAFAAGKMIDVDDKADVGTNMGFDTINAKIVTPLFFSDKKQATTLNQSQLRGTAMHACFELVTWLDRQTPTREQIVAAITKSVQAQLDANKAADMFFQWCKQPEIRSVLEQKTYQWSVGGNQNANNDSETSAIHQNSDVTAPFWEAQNERRFSVIPKPGVLLRGSIDRLTLLYDGSESNRRLVGADIIDYKTDRIPNEETLAHRIEYYLPQLKEYRNAVAAMYQLNHDQISMRLLFLNIGKVVSCAPYCTDEKK